MLAVVCFLFYVCLLFCSFVSVLFGCLLLCVRLLFVLVFVVVVVVRCWLLFAGRCVRFVVIRGFLFVVGCLLFVAYWLFAASDYCLSSGVCCLQFVVGVDWLLFG